jgi:predicted nucleotidyltransferase
VSAIQANIKSVVDQIVDRFSPQQIFLFGSHAYGAPTEGSDVDVLVVMDTDDPPLHAAAHISASIDHPLPLDIIVRTPDEFAEQLAEHSSFESRIQRDGISLHEAPN